MKRNCVVLMREQGNRTSYQVGMAMKTDRQLQQTRMIEIRKRHFEAAWAVRVSGIKLEQCMKFALGGLRGSRSDWLGVSSTAVVDC